MKQFTDFPNSYFPNPKPLAKVKMPKAMKKVGKKTKSWTEKRNELKEEFAKMGIFECELRLKNCWRNTALGFAHATKRRKLTKEDLGTVILVCNPCHEQIEYLDSAIMSSTVYRIIAMRRPKK